MLIVGLDTSGKDGSLALAEAVDSSLRLLGEAALAGRMYSTEIIPQLTALLAGAERTKRNINAFAVVSGPGSFTGLRVGLATIKALADAWSLPIAAVSMLEVIAARSLSHTAANPPVPALSLATTTVVLEAGRSELFAATFTLASPIKREGDEMILKFEEFIERFTRAEKVHPADASLGASPASATPNARLITPDEPVAFRLRAASLTVQVVPRPTAADVAAYGYTMLQQGRTTTAATLDANYVRRSDAELYGTKG